MIKHSEKPETITVTSNVAGEPLNLTRNGGWQRVISIYERWRLADNWWAKEEKRAYFKIKTSLGWVGDIYHEQVSGRWYIERIYD